MTVPVSSMPLQDCLLRGVSSRAARSSAQIICREGVPVPLRCHARALNPTEVLGAFGLPRVMRTLGKAGANPDHILWWMINHIREPGGVDYFRALTGGQVPNVGRFVPRLNARGVPISGTRILAEPFLGEVMGPKGVGYFAGLADGFYNGSLGAGVAPILPLGGPQAEAEAAAAGDKPNSPTIKDILRIIEQIVDGVGVLFSEDSFVPSPEQCGPLKDLTEVAELPLPPNQAVLTEPLETRFREPVPGPGNNGIRPTSMPLQQPTGRNAALLPTSLTAFGAQPVVPFSKSITPLSLSWVVGLPGGARTTFHQINPPNPWQGPAPPPLKVNPVVGVTPGITAVQTNQFGGPVGVPVFIKKGIQFAKNP